MPADVMKVQLQQVEGDCAIASLATYVGLPYAEVMRIVGKVIPTGGRRGLWTGEIIRVAALLGVKLRCRRRPDFDDIFGLLCTPDHVAVIRNGLVFEGNGLVIEWEHYLTMEKLAQRDVSVLSAD